MSRTNKLLINEYKTCVDELLDNVAFTNPGLVRLEGHSVIVRDDINNFKSTHVTVISGGGSGHEPFPSGFVGKGMLSAAVCGDVFASPSSSEVFAAVKSVSSSKGVIMLVANYTGDRLNFGIARERAVQTLGIKVETIVVGEDCALLPNDKTAGRRGLVGIVFAMKIAGSMSEEGKSIENICEVLRAVENTKLENEKIAIVLSCVEAACKKLLENEHYINKLDGEGVGDADCGSTLARGSNEILNNISNWQSIKSIGKIFMKIATTVENSMGGASGGIYSLFFTTAANKLKKCCNSSTNEITMFTFIEAFRSGIISIQKYGGAKLGDRTMLDALIPACNENCIKNAVDAAWKGAETTKHMVASAGRASYVSREIVANKMDAGAYAVALIVQTISDKLDTM